jgi:hypothetical protein
VESSDDSGNDDAARRLRDLLLGQFALRVQPEMEQYVLRRMKATSIDASGAIPVMGCHARTGVPRRQFVPADLLARALNNPHGGAPA